MSLWGPLNDDNTRKLGMLLHGLRCGKLVLRSVRLEYGLRARSLLPFSRAYGRNGSSKIARAMNKKLSLSTFTSQAHPV